MAYYQRGRYKLDDLLKNLEGFIVNKHTDIYQLNDREIHEKICRSCRAISSIKSIKDNKNEFISHEIYLSKSEISKTFAISRPTIDKWISQNEQQLVIRKHLGRIFIEITSLYEFLRYD